MVGFHLRLLLPCRQVVVLACQSMVKLAASKPCPALACQPGVDRHWTEQLNSIVLLTADQMRSIDIIGMKKTVKQALEPMQIGDIHAFLGRE